MRKYIGDKQFYKMLLKVALPIMLQNGISNFVSLLDNIMVGRLGTEQMSGVSIVNQLIFVFFLCIFGTTGGIGIFTAQFAGQKNDDGIRQTFRFKIIMTTIILVAFMCLFVFKGDDIISLFLHEGSEEGSLELTLKCAKIYLLYSLVGLVPYVIESVYSSSMRECGETVIPMIASVIAVFVNLIFNYILIFGKFGAPAMGVAGAALATTISRFIQVAIVIVYLHSRAKKFTFIHGVYKTLKVEIELVKKMIIMSLPLIFNETLWAGGMTLQTQAYSIRGLASVAALNINGTIFNVFSIAFIALGDAVAIIVGQQLGAGEHKKAEDTAYKIIFFSTIISTISGVVVFILAPVFPRIYNTTDEVMDIARNLIERMAILFPVNGFLHATYFTIRSGGKTGITFVFDSCFLWVVTVPLAYLLVFKTGLPVYTVYFIVEATNIIKSFIGWLILRSGLWIQTIVE